MIEGISAQTCYTICGCAPEAITEAYELETWERPYVPPELRSTVDPYDGLGAYAGGMLVLFTALFIGALAVISERDK